MKRTLAALFALVLVFGLAGCKKPLRSIYIGEDFTLEVGQQVNLVPQTDPQEPDDYELEWSSSDETIVKIGQNGEVLGNAPGQATVRVQTPDGAAFSSVVVTVVLPKGEPSVALNSFERLVFDALIKNVELQAENDVVVTGYEILQTVEYAKEQGLLSLYINVFGEEDRVIDSNVMVLALEDTEYGGADFPFGSLARGTIAGETLAPGELNADAVNTALREVLAR